MKNFEHQNETPREKTNRNLQFDRLLDASHKARTIRAQIAGEAGNANTALYYASLPINYYLLNYVYKTEGITEFNKFNEWKKKGASVIKGSKAFPIWGQPIGTQKEERAEEKGEEYTATEEENSRFPICYVFSNLQVKSIEEKKGGQNENL
jgi:hypothetical protein